MRNYNRDGEPISDEEAIRLFADHEYRQIADTEYEGVRVSTVLLVIDHNFCREGPPIIFETMIFGGVHDQWQDRYSTLEQAEAGHVEACAMVWGYVQGGDAKI